MSYQEITVTSGADIMAQVASIAIAEGWDRAVASGLTFAFRARPGQDEFVADGVSTAASSNYVSFTVTGSSSSRWKTASMNKIRNFTRCWVKCTLNPIAQIVVIVQVGQNEIRHMSFGEIESFTGDVVLYAHGTYTTQTSIAQDLGTSSQSLYSYILGDGFRTDGTSNGPRPGFIKYKGVVYSACAGQADNLGGGIPSSMISGFLIGSNSMGGGRVIHAPLMWVRGGASADKIPVGRLQIYPANVQGMSLGQQMTYGGKTYAFFPLWFKGSKDTVTPDRGIGTFGTGDYGFCIEV